MIIPHFIYLCLINKRLAPSNLERVSKIKQFCPSKNRFKPIFTHENHLEDPILPLSIMEIEVEFTFMDMF